MRKMHLAHLTPFIYRFSQKFWREKVSMVKKKFWKKILKSLTLTFFTSCWNPLCTQHFPLSYEKSGALLLSFDAISSTPNYNPCEKRKFKIHDWLTRDTCRNNETATSALLTTYVGLYVWKGRLKIRRPFGFTFRDEKI